MAVAQFGGMDAVFQKRLGQSHENETSGMAETARSAAESSAKGGPGASTSDEGISLFWRVFGGTILSITALVSITVFNNIWSNITELRAELNREREARAELVKKDEFNARTSSQYERIRSFDGLKAELEGLKERANTNAAAIDGLKKDSAAALDAARKELTALTDGFKKDAAGLEVIKERVVGLEAIKKEVAGIELLRERLAGLTADVKAAREELAKLTQEAERNKSGDAERKAFRDTQHRQVDETIKELQKDVQLCREKLARLEGSQPVPSPGGPAKPKSDGNTSPGASKPGPDGE